MCVRRSVREGEGENRRKREKGKQKRAKRDDHTQSEVLGRNLDLLIHFGGNHEVVTIKEDVIFWIFEGEEVLG